MPGEHFGVDFVVNICNFMSSTFHSQVEDAHLLGEGFLVHFI